MVHAHAAPTLRGICASRLTFKSVLVEVRGIEWLRFEHLVAGAGCVMESTWREFTVQQRFLCTPTAWRAMRHHANKTAGLVLGCTADLTKRRVLILSSHPENAPSDKRSIINEAEVATVRAYSRFYTLYRHRLLHHRHVLPVLQTRCTTGMLSLCMRRSGTQCGRCAHSSAGRPCSLVQKKKGGKAKVRDSTILIQSFRLMQPQGSEYNEQPAHFAQCAFCLQALRKRFPEVYVDLVLMRQLATQRQLEILASASVLVSTVGSKSFRMALLQDGAQV